MESLKKRALIEYTEDEMPFCRLDDETISILGQNVVLTLGTDRDIQIFPEKSWEIGLERLNSFCEKHPEAGNRFRFLVTNSFKADLTGGTMTLPDLLIEYANISSEAWLIIEDDRISLKAAEGTTSETR